MNAAIPERRPATEWNTKKNTITVKERSRDLGESSFCYWRSALVTHQEGDSAAIWLPGGSEVGGFQRLSRERVHALGVVLEIHKPVTVVQLNLKLPQHGKTQKARNLRPCVAAYGGEVQRDDA